MPHPAPAYGYAPNQITGWGTSDHVTNWYAQILKLYPFHLHCNQYSVRRHLGPLQDTHVLDLPSGEGPSARYILEQGAAVLTSVDISPAAIEKCRQIVMGLTTVPRPLEKWHGVMGNAAEKTMYPGGPFDVLIVSFLFENLSTDEEMRAAAENLFQNGKPGARMVGIVAIGGHEPEDAHVIQDEFGMDVPSTNDVKEGDIVNVDYRAVPDCVLNYRYRKVETYRKVLEGAGFVEVEFVRYSVDPKYEGKQNLYRFAKHSANRIILARKPL